jgi:hypothetical protein
VRSAAVVVWCDSLPHPPPPSHDVSVPLSLFAPGDLPAQAAEQYLRSSGLRYTIVRPGGLSDKGPSEVGRLIVGKEDTLFGRDSDPGRAISRDTVSQDADGGFGGIVLIFENLFEL